MTLTKKRIIEEAADYMMNRFLAGCETTKDEHLAKAADTIYTIDVGHNHDNGFTRHEGITISAKDAEKAYALFGEMLG